MKIAFRNLIRRKAYSVINILGLSVGVAGCLLIILFIQNEFSYDRFITDHDRIYRMTLERSYPNHSTHYAVVPHSFAAAAKENFEEIEEATIATRITNQELTYINAQEEKIRFDEDLILAVDSLFLKVFDFKPLLGKSSHLLTQPDEMVITEEFSQRYFAGEDPIGKVISVDAELQFTVSAVIPDIPDNSHFKFSALVSIYVLPFTNQENYTTCE